MLCRRMPPEAKQLPARRFVLRPSDDCTVASWRVKWGAKKFLQDLSSTPKTLENKVVSRSFSSSIFRGEAEIEIDRRGKLVSRMRQVNAFAYTVELISTKTVSTPVLQERRANEAAC